MILKYVLLTIFLLIPLQPNTVEANSKKNIVCYYGSWTFYRNFFETFDISEDINPFLCTHIIYAYMGLEESGELGQNWRFLNSHNNLQLFKDLKLKNPKLKTLLSVGGRQASEIFALMDDAEKRYKFLKSSLVYMQKYDLDGLDIDWDFGIDIEIFVSLLEELKEEFHQYGYLLSAAVGPTEIYFHESYNISRIFKYLDLINVKSYDLHGPWEGVVGHNSPLYTGLLDVPEREKQHSFDGLAKYFLAQGAPPSKLVMGIPFFASFFTLKDPLNHDVGAEHIGYGTGRRSNKEAGRLPFHELCQKFQNEHSSWHFKWDSMQKVPFAYNQKWISYENETSISLKVDYVKKENLSGIMIRTVELDDFRGVCGAKPYPLLSFIHKRLMD